MAQGTTDRTSTVGAGVTNTAVVRLLSEMAALTEIDEGPQGFRVRAYQNAARAVEGITQDVAELSASALSKVKGIGSSTAKKIREYVDTGSIDKLEQLRAAHPPGQLELLRVQGIGAKTVQLLDSELGVTDLDGLRAALEDGRMASLPGMGTKTLDNLRRAIEVVGSGSKDRRVPTWRALPVAEELVANLEQVDGVRRAAYAGSLRRLRTDIGDLDVLVAADEDAAPGVMAAFRELDLVDEVVASGSSKTTIVTREGLQVDLRVVPEASFGAAMVYFTGSKAHNIALRERALARSMTLNEYALAELVTDEDGDRSAGAALAGATEQDVYAALGMAWVPPEAREDRGEVALAADDALPEMADVADIRGDLHDHSTWSGDGRQEMDELVAACADRGLDYLAVTDHAEDLRINGVSREGMLAQRTELRALQDRFDTIHLLHGAELNIDADGDVDYDAAFLDGFDWGVASVHSDFDLPADVQTARLLRAIRNPRVNAIGHLSGRRIGKRAGITFDVDAVLDACVETGTAIEVNSNPQRLDATWEVVRAGAERGVFFVISTDAHALGELDHVRHGVRWARRGLLPKELVANTWPTDRFLDWVRSVRSGS